MTIKKVPSDLKIKIVLAICLIIFAIIFRLFPHPANFAPIAAVAIFAGAILPMRWALTLPLAAIIASDLIIGMHSLILFTWGSFLAIAWLCSRYLKNIKAVNIGFASLGASTLFYLVSNFGVWLEGRLYPPTLEGLISCYYNALPFFRNTLLGDLAYSALIFGAYYLACKSVIGIKNRLSLAGTN
ncbi:hypothetical protein KY385_00535 [Candidatus Parcubacteria bacterium]|nr:hypothetical protein [Candidatus Parcubacteria bacterium]